MNKLKLKSKWNEFEAGSVIEVDEQTAKALKLAGIAEDWDPEEESKKEESDENLKSLINKEVTEAVKSALSNNQDGNVRVRFEVVEDEKEKNAKQGMLHIGDMLKAMAHGDQDALSKHRSAMKAALGNQEAVDADGGYLVESQFLTRIVDHLFNSLVLTRGATRIPVTAPASNGISYPELDDYDRTDGNHAVNVYRISEAAAKTKSTPQFGKITINLEKLVGLWYATDELLMDREALAAVVEQWFVREFSYKLDYEALRGSGSGEMLGILDNSNDALVTVNRAGAGAISGTDVFNMYARMWANGFRNCEWFVSNTAYAALQGITVGNQPVFLPPVGNGGAIAAPSGTLLGRPIRILEQASTLGTKGDLNLFDMSQYVIAEKGGIERASSIHVQFTTDQTVTRWVMRNNGRPMWSNVITPNQGSASLSAFVTLGDVSS